MYKVKIAFNEVDKLLVKTALYFHRAVHYEILEYDNHISRGGFLNELGYAEIRSMERENKFIKKLFPDEFNFEIFTDHQLLLFRNALASYITDARENVDYKSVLIRSKNRVGFESRMLSENEIEMFQKRIDSIQKLFKKIDDREYLKETL